MDTGILLAALVQEGGRVLTEVIRSNYNSPEGRLHKTMEIVPDEESPIPRFQSVTTSYDVEPDTTSDDVEQKTADATGIKKGCIPCALGHVGTCTGLLDEALRFARSEGMENPTTIDRMNKCLDELNTMERGDLTQDQIKLLPKWQQDLAEEVLLASRKTRHQIEDCFDLDSLKGLTADVAQVRGNLGQEYYRNAREDRKRAGLINDAELEARDEPVEPSRKSVMMEVKSNPKLLDDAIARVRENHDLTPEQEAEVRARIIERINMMEAETEEV